MNKRRSMNAAIDITPESLAFIRGGVPTGPGASTVEPAIEATNAKQSRPEVGPISDHSPIKTDLETQEPIELETVVTESDNHDRKRPKGRGKGAGTHRDEPMVAMANLLVPLTTRLSPSTAAALKRAGLEQKLYGRQPATVQEIAEIAIRAWLGEQGYLS